MRCIGRVLMSGDCVYRRIRVEITPDGGLSRLGLYADVPEDVAREFVPLEQASWIRFADEIPKTRKPMTLPFVTDDATVARTIERLEKAEQLGAIDWASAAFGAEMLGATNEHYGPAAAVISPFPPLHMFDGLESARSRDPGHFEEARIRLGKPIRIGRIELDFHFFVNNNPCDVEILAALGNDGEWTAIVARSYVKPFAGNRKAFIVTSCQTFDRILLRTFPDGGVNRVHVYAVPFGAEKYESASSRETSSGK
jgi:allantoicase